MTFNDIQGRVLDRLNLTSATATTRVGQFINERYRQVLSGIGAESIVRQVVSAPTIIGVRTVTFPAIKLFSVFDPNFTPPLVMGEITFDEMRNRPTYTGDPSQNYAIQNEGSTTVTIMLESTPATVHLLNADAEVSATDLSTVQVPIFAVEFHDILIHGALCDELQHLEKYEEADIKEKRFKERLDELKFFLVKSAYLDLYQGKRQIESVTVPLAS